MILLISCIVSSDSRMITDCHASTGSRHECAMLPKRIEYQRDELGLPIEEVIADRGYGRGPTYAQLREHTFAITLPCMIRIRVVAN